MRIKRPDIAAELDGPYKDLVEDEKKSLVGQYGRPYAAFMSGAPEVALKDLAATKEAFKNSGRADDVKSIEQVEELAKTNPRGAAALLAVNLSGLMGMDKFGTEFERFSLLPDKQIDGAAKAKYAERQQLAELGQKNAAARASDASAAEARSKTGNLPEDVQKDYVAAVKGIKPERDKISDFDDLAKNLEGIAGKGKWVDRGAAGWVNEAFKDAAGWQDNVSRINQRYLAAVSDDIKARQRPGDQMTEGDFKVAMQAYPSVNSNPALKAQTIRDLEKAAQARLQTKIVTAEFAQKNGSFNPAVKPFKVQGIDVKTGDTFDSVVSALAAKSGNAQPAPTPVSSAAAGAPTPQQVQSARDYISHPGADPAKVAALKAKYSAAGVQL